MEKIIDFIKILIKNIKVVLTVNSNNTINTIILNNHLNISKNSKNIGLNDNRVDFNYENLTNDFGTIIDKKRKQEHSF